MLCLEECWREGFKAGELFIKQCPYSGNSLEARNWRNGWLEGAAKSVGLDYHATPVVLDPRPFMLQDRAFTSA